MLALLLLQLPSAGSQSSGTWGLCVTSSLGDGALRGDLHGNAGAE